MIPTVLNRQQVRLFDKIAVERFQMNSLVLMENAARGATDVLCEVASGRSAVILCGGGNNGGDGLVMARHLHLREWKTKVILFANPADLSQDSAANLRILTHTNIPIVDGVNITMSQLAVELNDFVWIVDAIVGTGATPPLRPPLDEVVKLANSVSANRMAIDVPRGLDCDSDKIEGTVYDADLTVSFVAFKPVMLTDTGKTRCGEIRIVDIGAPPEIFEHLDGD